MNIDLNALYEKNPEATIYVGGIDKKVTSDILWELFTQCGIVVNITLPRDKISQDHVEYGFVEFQSEEDAEYAIKIMNMVRLYGKQLKLNKASQDKRSIDVGANIWIGNLDPEVDEKTLFDTFQNFGMIISTKIMRNIESGVSKGYGFVSYESFEASDSAIDAMNGQFFYNRIINVQYAIKKDSKNGERHGSAAERLLAANRPINNQFNKPGFTSLQMQQYQQQQQSLVTSQQQMNIQVNVSNQQELQQQVQNVTPVALPPIPNMPNFLQLPIGMPNLPLLPPVGPIPNLPMPPIPGHPGIPSLPIPPLPIFPQQIKSNLPNNQNPPLQ